MDSAIIQSILTEEFKAKVESNTYSLDDKRKLTVLVQQGQGVMSVQDVKQLRFASSFVALSTEDDVYYLEADSMLGLKGANPEIDTEEKRTGFRR